MDGSKRTVAGVILDILAEQGVKQAFGIPGVHNLGFWNALSKNRPEIVSVRHEQSCVYAADGLARATGKLSVAITTTGPGAANTLGAFGEAAISGSQLLLISSETPMKNRVESGARGILHEMNDQSVFDFANPTGGETLDPYPRKVGQATGKSYLNRPSGPAKNPK